MVQDYPKPKYSEYACKGECCSKANSRSKAEIKVIRSGRKVDNFHFGTADRTDRCVALDTSLGQFEGDGETDLLFSCKVHKLKFVRGGHICICRPIVSHCSVLSRVYISSAGTQIVLLVSLFSCNVACHLLLIPHRHHIMCRRQLTLIAANSLRFDTIKLRMRGRSHTRL